MNGIALARPTATTRHARRLVPFAVASLGLHGLLLAVTAAGPAAVATGDWPSLRVALSAPAAPAPATATVAEPARAPAPPDKKEKLGSDSKFTPTNSSLTPIRASDPTSDLVAEPRPAREHGSRAPAADALVALIRTDFARHFAYPRLARRRGWEGEVLLGFTVDGSGRIIDIRIARSSGHPTLDDAARAALERVRRVTAPLAPTELELPVVYRLEG